MKTFQKDYILKADPDEVYTALTNPFTIELWTGYPAVMEEKDGIEFSMWDGDIQGRNIKLEKNRKIIQEWYFGEEYPSSTVTILLFKHNRGTKARVIHENIPEEAYENMREGWNNNYFGNLQRFFDI